MKDHVTVSQKTFIFNGNGKFLALLRTESAPTRPLKWDLPGGLFEHGEFPKESARREITEETSLTVGELEPVTIESETYPDGNCVITIAYKTILIEGELKLSFEHKESRWVTPIEFVKLDSSPKWQKIVEDYLI